MEGASWSFFSFESGVPSLRLSAVLADSRGGIWFGGGDLYAGTEGGLACYIEYVGGIR
jgi:ligand-binding sensor domain-containing protein